MLESWLDGYLDAAQPELLEEYHEGNSWKQAPRKKFCYNQNQWRQDPPGVGYTQGKRGAQRHAACFGRSPALKPQCRWWQVSGQGEREAGEGRPAVGNGQEHHRCCAPQPAVLTGVGALALPKVASMAWREEKTQGKGFTGRCPLLLWDCWWRRRVGAGVVCRY